jgi:DNA-binding transcriptional LysR family regulator
LAWADALVRDYDAGRDVLAALDLNMLPALRALLQERSVTRAAARLGLRQPAASAALRRLRTHFKDPLLLRTGPTYELSPLAAALLAQVEQVLAAAEAVLLERANFDSATSRRRFTVMATDADFLPVCDRVLRHLATCPGITLDLIPVTAAALHDLETALHGVDLLLMPRGAASGYPSTSLWDDEWALVVGDHALIDGGRLTPERLSRMIWIEPFRGALKAATCMDAWGVQPRAQISAPSATLLLILLRDSPQHATILQRRVAEQLSTLGGIRVLDGPAPPPPLQMAQWWHPSRADDPGHSWLRSVLRRAAADLRNPPSPPV